MPRSSRASMTESPTTLLSILSLLRRHVGDDIVLVAIGDAREYAHGGAGNHDRWKRYPRTEQALGPLEGRDGAERIGVFESRHTAGAPAHDTKQVRPDPVVAAFVDG